MAGLVAECVVDALKELRRVRHPIALALGQRTVGHEALHDLLDVRLLVELNRVVVVVSARRQVL
jgi:hypothetical protein